MRVPWKKIVAIAALAGALAWSLSGVDFNEVIAIWAQTNRWGIFAVLGLTLCDVFVRSCAWKLIVNPIKHVPLLNVFRVYIIGLFSSLVLPFRMGDVAQGYFLGRKEAISKVSTLSTVAVRRLFEVMSLVVLMGILVVGFSLDFPYRDRAFVLAGILITGIVVVMAVIHYRRILFGWIERLVSRVSVPLALRLRTTLVSVVQGAAALHSIRTIAGVFALSLLAWCIEMLMIQTVASAMGISLDIMGAGVVLLTLNIGLLVSPTPGNVGTYQFLCILALSWYSVSKSRALSFSILLQVIQGLPILVSGPILLLLESNRVRPSTAPQKESH